MKIRKLFLAFVLLLSIFLIYIFTNEEKLNYIAIGDSLTLGENPYGQINYSYADYVKDYLDKNALLRFYTKGYATKGYTTTDLLNDIKNDKKIEHDGKTINIKKTLREADLVTITIGINDLVNNLKFDTALFELMDEKTINSEINKLIKNNTQLLKEVKKYAKKDIIVIGYYNPIPKQSLLIQNKLDQIFKVINNKYKKVCNDNSIIYIDVYENFKNNPDYLPNPFNIHPNTKGYQSIGNKVIDIIEKKIIN